MSDPKIGTIYVYWAEQPTNADTALLCKAFPPDLPNYENLARAFARQKLEPTKDMVFAGKLTTIITEAHRPTGQDKSTRLEKFDFK
jgi:hypothetical protein